MLTRLRAQLPAWRRALRRRRRTLAVLALALTAAVLLPAYLPPTSQGTAVVVAAGDLPAGTVLAPEDLRTVRVAEELAPEGTAHSAPELSGRTTAVPVSAGTPLLPGLLGDQERPSVPEGSVLMLVPAPAALAPHLAPGTRIDVVTTDVTSGSTKAVAALVVDLAASDEGSAGVPLGGAGTGTAQVLVAVDRVDSRDVAHALAGGLIMIAIIG